MLLGNSGTAAESPFAVDAETGFLQVTRALDREEQSEYQLQVGLSQVCVCVCGGEQRKQGGALTTLPPAGHPRD